jgi:hypothetical protein
MPVKILKCQIDKLGYVRIRFCVETLKTTHKVHRLVAKAFIENPNDLPQVNHKDGDKENNAVTNLEWCTNGENQIHAITNGLKIHHFGDRAKRFTGKVEAYDCTGKLVAVMSGNEDMAKHGFDFRLVSAVLKNKRKSHRGCTFKKLEKENNHDSSNSRST